MNDTPEILNFVLRVLIKRNLFCTNENRKYDLFIWDKLFEKWVPSAILSDDDLLLYPLEVRELLRSRPNGYVVMESQPSFIFGIDEHEFNSST